MSILITFTKAVTWFIEEFGLLGIFLTMAAESCLIPIPSEIVMPFSGYVAWLNNSQRFLIEATITSTIGNLIGSIALYYIGARIGRPFIVKYGRYFLVSEGELKYAEELFRRYGSYAVFFGRMMPAVRTIISFPAGLFKLEIPKFIILTLIGSIPWNFALTYLGFRLGPYWTTILDYSAYIDPIIVVAAAALLLYVLFRSRRRAKLHGA
ncbi:MAG TPA: DedA family protein [Nitrososphaeria archaeon]|nr:MAG: DedA family protein [Nitrososphaerota archaeon]HDJ67255.1 DedA family protein [Nitrososphaeria archaeon]